MTNILRRLAQPLGIFLVLVTIPHSASPADINFKASAGLQATVGLDQKTQDFINALLPDVRQQVLQLLQQALSLIDDSVEKYLQKVDDIINSQIDHLQCAAQGAGDHVVHSIWETIFPWSKSTPLESLQEDRDKTIAEFSVGDPAMKYASVYGDLLSRATGTACDVSLTPETAAMVQQVQQGIRARWRAWNSASESCTDAFSCYDWLYDVVSKEIAASDKRDVDAVHGSDRMNAVTRPPQPGLLGKWDPTAVEVALNEMFAIKAGIEVAQVARENLAQQNIADAEPLVTHDEQMVAEANSALSTTNISGNDKARNIISDLPAVDDEITADLNAADNLTVLKKADVSNLRDRYNKMLALKQSVIANAAAYNDKIKTAPPGPAIIINRGQGPKGGG